MSPKAKVTVGLILFFLAILIGLALSVPMIWTGAEAAHYGFPPMAEKKWRLHCPHYLALDESGTVSATVKNTNDFPVTLKIRWWASIPLDLETGLEYRELKPGQSWHWSHKVGPHNRDLHRFIFFSAYYFGGYPMPRRQGMCGIFVLPFGGIPGRAVLWFGLALFLVLGVAGWWLWREGSSQITVKPLLANGVAIFAVLIPLTVAVALWGSWALGIALVAADVLALIIFALALIGGQEA